MTSTPVARGGIPFDRSFMLVDESENRKGKPLTARQEPKMLAFRASADSGKVSVRSPEGSIIDADQELAAKVEATFARPVSIQSKAPDGYPFFDDNDILVINAASVRALAAAMGVPVDIMRFRPSIVLDGDGARAFEENQWIGRRFGAGTAAFELVELNIRCVFTNIDPKTFEVDPSFLKYLVDHHNQRFGVYATVRAPGSIAVGDEWREQV